MQRGGLAVDRAYVRHVAASPVIPVARVRSSSIKPGSVRDARSDPLDRLPGFTAHGALYVDTEIQI